MSDRNPLQAFEDSQYERPNQKWICGHAATGCQCPLGPDEAGYCRATDECVPTRNGDRWQCNRSPLRGGKCENGPGPDGKCACSTEQCSPVRSLRSRRGIFTLCCTAATIGILALVLTSNRRYELLSPGSLTENHAQILADASQAENCANCHPSANDTLTTWVKQTIGLESHADTHAHETQSALCMKCHTKSLNQQFAMNAHGSNPDYLRELTTLQQDDAEVALVSHETDALSHGNIACSTCHREHHGRNHDLDLLTNQQCQNCHARQFNDFASHPEFDKWPYVRRQRIAFDHAAHSAKHFVAENRAFNCADCHINGDAQQPVSAIGYQSCASCHDKGIRSSVADGAQLIALPLVDIDALEEAGFPIGEWPVDAQGDFDGEIPPLMRLMLRGDTNCRSILDRRGADFSFSDIDPDDTDDLRDAAALAWGVKTIIYELADCGCQLVKWRLRNLYNVSVDDLTLSHITGQVSGVVLKSTQEAWFPRLMEEIPRQKNGEQITRETFAEKTPVVEEPLVEETVDAPEPPATPIATATVNDDTIQNEPQKLPTPEFSVPRADTFPNNFQPAPAVPPQQPIYFSPPQTAPAQPQFDIHGNPLRPLPYRLQTYRFQSGKLVPQRLPSAERQYSVIPTAFQDELLDENEMLDNDDLLTDSSDDSYEQLMSEDEEGDSLEIDASDDLLESELLDQTGEDLLDASDDSDDGLLLDDEDSGDLLDEDLLGGDDLDDEAEPQVQENAKKPKPKPNIGGWYRNDTTFSIGYRPTGHDDAFLKTWLEFLADQQGVEQGTDSDVFQKWTNPVGFGQCASCHSVDTIDNKTTINWKGKFNYASTKKFTKFSHAPHVVLPALADCISCHQIDTTHNYMTTYLQRNPHNFTSGFHDVTKASCASCHTPHSAGDDCVKCHNYHVGNAAAKTIQFTKRRLSDLLR